MACHTIPRFVQVDCSVVGEEQLAQTFARTEHNPMTPFTFPVLYYYYYYYYYYYINSLDNHRQKLVM
jgi:hypothetical protein